MFIETIREASDMEGFEEDKYIPVPESGCWLWLRAVDKDGYGATAYDGKSIRAHRLSYKLHKGPIPKGKIVRHTCDTPGCVNPNHLVLGTHKDNAADRDVRGRNHQTKKTHCKYGHKYTKENTYFRKNGSRLCRKCNRERTRLNRERMRLNNGRKS